MGTLTGDFLTDAVILGASALCSSCAALLWWSLRRNIAALDERQRVCDVTRREHSERLAEDRARLAVIEDRLDIRRK